MKNKFLLLAVVVVMVATGFFTARYARQSPEKVFHSHTILYTTKDYDEKGVLYATGSLTRVVEKNGIYHQRQVTADGRVINKDAVMDQPMIRPRQPIDGERVDKYLGYDVLVQKRNGTEFWLAPALEDCLKVITYRPDGSVDFVLEAVSVQP
ncbi:MAG: hypothetical protein JWM21_3080 [Acidobacteria bacterium]|nr:hypothetical protein [Acidobacteriota bacterium]